MAAEILAAVVAAGWRLSHSPPPYVRELPLPDLPRLPRKYSLLILDLLTAEVDFIDLQYVIRSLRFSFAMPVFTRLVDVVGLPPPGFHEAVVTAGGELLPAADAIGQRAHAVLTARWDLSRDWIGWLRLQHTFTSRQEQAIRALLDNSSACGSVREMLASGDFAESTVRRWLAEGDLPRAGALFRAGRLLRELLRLQRHPRRTVEQAATELGYGSADAFSNQMFRYFEHTATKGRSRLGLEPRFRAFDAYAARDPS